MENFEKLGTFYLGKEYDTQSGKVKDDLVLYDSKDLVTHAVCVGMTGSGKTGLCISLIEEAAIDGVPAILIDPKGDLANLLLTFPNLGAQDFLPWINPDDARQKGMTPEEYANKQADTWKNGLAGWGQDGARIQRLKDSAEVLIYTPGSNAGLPVSIVQSFAVPPSAIMEDNEMLRDRVSTMVTSLLGLVGIQADPVQNREHILLSTLVETAWRQGQDLDLASLIRLVQAPPIGKIGVLDLDTFYPSKDRFSLVLALNNLLASPGFDIWQQGTPLDIGQILYSPTGKPRISIFSIAHLGDPERMFFVSMLMNQILGWMRGQSGTTSLRAIVYMDEIFGFLPPIANPPSKLPIITLLKQARAFGVGLVLATQNPVDLDYKALGNAGTWFIGRLQTERDKSRLLDGLDTASTTSGTQFNRGQLENIISGLGNRVFLMSNTHEDAPVLFQTRWALSYLRGPLTRDQIKKLMDPIKALASPGATAQKTTPAIAPPIVNEMETSPQTALPPDISSFYIPVRGSGGSGKKLIYAPGILGAAKINFRDSKSHVDLTESKVFTTPVTDNAIPVIWENAKGIDILANELEKKPQADAQFMELPSTAGQSKNYAGWNREFANWLYGEQKLELMASPALKEVSNPGESERDFRIRLQQVAREQRDALAEGQRKKYAVQLATLQERKRKAQQAVAKQAEQAKHAKIQTAISFGGTLLGAFTGRKVSSTTISRASTAMRGASRAVGESQDVARAEETVEAIEKQITDLQMGFDAEITKLQEKIDPSTEALDAITIKPKKSDILVQLVALTWIPYWQDELNNRTPAW